MYPYAVINKGCDIEFVCRVLKSFEYHLYYSWATFQKHFHTQNQTVYIVLDSCREFGTFCFYDENKINKNIKREFVEDIYEFLRLAADYKNCNEY